jgi:TetR/AcrR family transcriptional regulator
MSRTIAAAVTGGRRETILDHAEHLFAEHGYKGAVLADIARAAGLGNAGLIHHFPGKAALYRAVLERLAGDLDERLAAALGDETDPGRRLAAFVQVQVRWALDRPLAFRLLQRELLDNPDRVASAHVLPLAGFIATGKAIVEDAQTAGLVAPGPGEVALCLVVGAVTYAAVVRPTFRQMLKTDLLGSDEAWLTTIADAILALLTATPRRA